MSAREPGAGEVLVGRYRLVAPMGRGGMGAVWRAEHLVLSSPVAVKLIHARAAHAQEAQARFLREAQAAAALRSPHVVQVLDYGVHEDIPFIVMELLEGESLAARLARQGKLSVSEAARIITHVARAIHKAHEAGIVHRDLKPDNVFLVRNSDEEIAKVLDFGIAKVADGFGEAGAATHTGAVLGSPHYMSPEQARGTRAVDHRSDLWALGVIAFQCLTGRRPFESEVLGDLLMRICAEPIPVPSQVAPVPHGFDAWFARATERDPERRFQSAWEMAESLRQLAGVTSTSLSPPLELAESRSSLQPAPPSMQPSLAQQKKGNSALMVLAIGAFALIGATLIVVVLVIAWQARPSPTAEPAASDAGVAPAVSTALPEPTAAAETSASGAPAASPVAQAPVRSGSTGKASATSTAAGTSAAKTPLSQLQEAEAKIKDAEQKIKAAEAKVKAAEQKVNAAGGASAE